MKWVLLQFLQSPYGGRINKYILHTCDLTSVNSLIKPIFITDCIYGYHAYFVRIVITTILFHIGQL